jgi:hypothetical protein
MSLHMRDMKNLERERELREECRAIAWITAFYVVVLIVYALTYFPFGAEP